MPHHRMPILCSQPLLAEKHVCAIFNSKEEADEIIGEFLAEGYRQGHMTLAMIDPDNIESTAQNLTSRGVDIAAGLSSGQLAIKTWSDTYYRSGTFTAEKMVAFVEESMKSARKAGHSQVWATGDMNWASQEDLSISIELVRYEALLNDLKDQCGDDVWVCFYDSNRFNGRVIADIIRAHPIVLLGRQVFENPFYTRPQEFLIELADWERKSKSRNFLSA